MKNIKMFQDFKNFNDVNESVNLSVINEVDVDNFYPTTKKQKQQYTNQKQINILNNVSSFISKFNSNGFFTSVLSIRNGEYILQLECPENAFKNFESKLKNHNAVILEGTHAEGYDYHLIISIS
jgi:inorganic pyrophosphatase/exopolyphosphatase